MRFISKLLITVPVFFMIYLQSFAQQKDAGIQLNEGDPAPAIKFYKWVKGNPVTQFSKDKIYVVEFGATWCVPCRAAIPKLTSIARKYKGKVSVISFFVMEFNDQPLETKNPRYVSNVERYVAKQGVNMDYDVAVDDDVQTMQNMWLTGREGIPYIFVVDRNGLVAWIGSNPQALDSVIDAVNHKSYSIRKVLEKKEEKIQAASNNVFPIINHKPENVFFISALSRYSEGQENIFGIENSQYIKNYRWAKAGSSYFSKQGKIEVVGENLRRLYYMAYGDTLWNAPVMPNPKTGEYNDPLKFENARRSYGKYWYRPLLELTDSTLFEADYRNPQNRFNYYLQVPPQLASSQYLQEVMRKDLKLYFGYEVTIETRLMPCWKMTINDPVKLKPKDTTEGYKVYHDEADNYYYRNGEVRDLIFQLELAYGYTSWGNLVDHPELQAPFIDETGITQKIDYTFPAAYAKKILAIREAKGEVPFELYREMLQVMGFELTKGYNAMKVVVIRGPKN